MKGLLKQTNPDQPLGGHYKIISELGVGGFGQTFLAEDLHLPDHPLCVVKQLKPQQSDPKTLEMARRLFDLEARVLYKLGNHDQIPRLLAHFEDNQEFYLAQELIEGEALNQELKEGQPWSETQLIPVLRDVLEVLAFVHEQDVIHRDIKPSNLIRRRQDGKIVLIDFGAVKQVSTQVVDYQTGETRTISIGTQGYTPKEQLGGNPRFSSDLYAVGMVAIQALTTIHPRHLTEDPQTGEINWRHHAPQVSPELAAFLDCMVRYDFRARYPTAAQALEALGSIPTALAEPVPFNQRLSEPMAVLPTQQQQPLPTVTNPTASEMEESSTAIWVQTEPANGLPPTVKNTGSMEESPTLIRVQTEPTSELPPTVKNTGVIQPLATSHYSQQSEGSAPKIATAGLSQRQSVKPWLVLAVLGAVGAIALMAKTLLFPQLVPQITNPQGVSTDNPAVRSANKLAPSFPTNSPTETPTARATQTPTLPSPESSPTETPTASATQTPTPPSPTKLPASTQVSPSPVQPPAKPAPTPVRPVAKSAPPPQKPQASELLSQAVGLQQAGQHQKALALYDQAIDRQPDVAQAHWGRCYSLNALQQPREAIAACNKALDLNPNYPEALWSKGNALDQQQRHMEALQLYEQATALKPDFAEAWNNQGAALLALGRASEALGAFDQATALKPDFADAWANRGAALWSLKRFRRAIVSINRALQIQPNHQNALNLRKQAQEKLGR